MKKLVKLDFKQFHPKPVVGVDEVGRGCLAGDVFAGAVVLRSNELCDQLTDSKLLSEDRRQELACQIRQHHWVGIGIASLEEIERLNILQASLLAMKRAIEQVEKLMGLEVGHVLVDGLQKIPLLNRRQTAVVKGDLRCLPISAASIVAKVARDEYMLHQSKKHPNYGFEKNKGYASEFHRNQIRLFGPSPIHRKSFHGVKEYLPMGEALRAES